MKTCSKCKEEKPLDAFSKDRTRADGLNYRCKTCKSAEASLRYKEDPEKVCSQTTKWQKQNKEKVSAARKLWRTRNQEKAKKHSSDYYQRNVYERRARAAKQRANKSKRKASWANDQLIAAYYKEAKRLEELTGIKFHVDHIIPLQGELVSGLHVENNLQLLPAHENIGKSNSFDPETFVA